MRHIQLRDYLGPLISQHSAIHGIRSNIPLPFSGDFKRAPCSMSTGAASHEPAVGRVERKLGSKQKESEEGLN